MHVQDEGSEAVLRGNRIHDGKKEGLVICAGASATLENNDIHSNTDAGVNVLGEGSEAVLRGNRIHAGKMSGVLIYDGASATFENNTITDNDREGTGGALTGAAGDGIVPGPRSTDACWAARACCVSMSMGDIEVIRKRSNVNSRSTQMTAEGR